MQCYVAVLSEDLRSDLQSREDLATLVKTFAKPARSFFARGDYGLKMNEAFVVKGSTQLIKDTLDAYSHRSVKSTQMLSLYLGMDKKTIGKDTMYVAIQPTKSKWKYLPDEVQNADEGTIGAYRISMQKVIDSLPE